MRTLAFVLLFALVIGATAPPNCDPAASEGPVHIQCWKGDVLELDGPVFPTHDESSTTTFGLIDNRNDSNRSCQLYRTR